MDSLQRLFSLLLYSTLGQDTYEKCGNSPFSPNIQLPKSASHHQNNTSTPEEERGNQVRLPAYVTE